MPNPYKKESFINKANLIHNNYYNYSKVSYINNKSKVCIICSKHGEFWQIPDSHLRGRGCPACGKIKIIQKRTKTKEQFIKEAKQIHNNKYDYSKAEYIQALSKVCIICPKHGEFWQTPAHHLQGEGCPACAKNKKLSLSEFIAKANLIHNNKYDYSKAEYKSEHIKVCIICPKHGEFWQEPNSHLNGCGCPKCNSSHGEALVRNYLLSKNINFQEQKSFKFCKSKKELPFDFYLPNYNIVIEFQGIQHFKPIKRFGGEKQLHLQKHLDWLKRKFCLESGIIYLPINYNENIEQKIKEYIGE